ncbi:MAG: hypothetical protein V7K41_20145 [Nostoc sp.]
MTLLSRLSDSPSLNFSLNVESQAIANAERFPQSFPVSAKL